MMPAPQMETIAAFDVEAETRSDHVSRLVTEGPGKARQAMCLVPKLGSNYIAPPPVRSNLINVILGPK